MTSGVLWKGLRTFTKVLIIVSSNVASYQEDYQNKVHSRQKLLKHKENHKTLNSIHQYFAARNTLIAESSVDKDIC